MAKTDLRGRSIAITGASSGIGAATAIACADAGMAVTMLARREDKLHAVAQEIERRGGQAACVIGDVRDEATDATLLDTAQSMAPMYAVFANAGYGVEVDTLEMSEPDLDAMFEINFRSGLRLVRVATSRMLAGDRTDDRLRGHAMFCSSCLSKIGMPRYAAYCATKACQDIFARSMRLELAGAGIAVSSVHPIGTRTEFFETMADRSRAVRLLDLDRPMAQPPERVAAAVVKRLRSARGGEVWTSALARTAFALSGLAPGLTDRALGVVYKRRMACGDG